MSGYTKLYKSLITSTIWQEDNATRILWITMLALSEADGVVEGSIPGLARLAGVTLPECKAALEVLLSPDEYSRTPDNDGRRIQVIDSGWLILNREKYRDKKSDRSDYYKEYYQKRREKSNNSTCARNTQHVRAPDSTQAKTKTKEEEDKKKETKTNIGSCLSSEEFLALDLRIGKARNRFMTELQKVFVLVGQEPTTFARVTKHLVSLVQEDEWDISIFDQVLTWAKQCKASGADNPKGLFVDKVKEETGFSKQSPILGQKAGNYGN